MHSAEQFAGQVREDLVKVGASYQNLPTSAQEAFIALYVFADASLNLLTGVIEKNILLSR